jgi:hypothetical protein
MRAGVLCAFAFVVLAALPCAALGAPPARWPSTAEVRQYTPGLGAKDASCIALYYHGRLTRKAWLTPYYKLTSAEKLTTDAGFDRCLTRPRRVALIAREEALSFGRQAGWQCVARKTEARSRAVRLSMTTLARELSQDDKIFRACNVIGALYATVGSATKLVLTAAEQRCANRVGSANPLRLTAQTPSKADRKAVGQVFDRCVGRASEDAMWRRLFASYRPSAAIPCVAKHALAITFVTLFSNSAALQAQARRAAAACALSSGTTS